MSGRREDLTGRVRRAASHPRAPVSALVALGLAAAAWHLYLARGMVVFGDELGWAQRYRHLGSGMLELWGGWFDPLARLTYNAVFATVGLREQWPLALMAVGANLALVAAVYAYCRHLGRPWTGVLIGAALLLMGPAHYSLLWPLNSLNALGLAALPACLVLLERGRRREDLWALALLLVGMGFAGPVVVALCPALALWLLMREGGPTWRLAVPGIPFIVYAIAYLTLPGFTADQSLGTNLRLAPGHMVESAAASVAGIAGTIDTLTDLRPPAAAGALLALAVVALVALWPRLDAAARARVTCVAAVAITEWAFIAIARANLGAPAASRYIILGALPLLLIAVDLVRVAPRNAGRALGVALAMAAGVNAIALSDGAAYLRSVSDQARAELGGIELTMDALDSPAPVAGSIPLFYLDVSSWRVARTHLGPTFALDAQQLAAADAGSRAIADRMMLTIGALTLVPTPDGDAPRGVCTTTPPAGADQPIAPGAVVTIRSSGAPVSVTPRRFGDAGSPDLAATASPGLPLVARAVPDAGPAWRLAVAGGAEVCVA
ncbi:MAG: hypothetical protein RIB67_05145 [Miltoncostaeaceae bacterium]